MADRCRHPLRSPLSRRTAVQAGALGLFGLSLEQVASARASEGEASPHRPPKSVIYEIGRAHV